ncbi:MAG TPA: hypothetical protein VJY85_02185 [Candidatus Limnocylindria bacterium]|nr:hypothetical protein [Candidatus Limnocylindria bacterium]
MSEAKSKPRRGASGNVWSDEERAAMQESAKERKRQSKLSPEEERAAGEAEVQAKIAELPEADRAMAARVHELVTSNVPSYVPRTYYGMPAYAKDGKTICFFQPRSKFKVRYSTFGFQPEAALDDGDMWPIAFAVNELTPAVEKRIVELARQAAG